MLKNTQFLRHFFIGSVLQIICLTSAYAHEGHHSHDHDRTYLGFHKMDSIDVSDDLVSCTLRKGTETKCYKITVKISGDTGVDSGPWCPQNINDGPDKAGIWLQDGKVYDADGEFVKNLARFYGDDKWQLFNPETGKVRVTDSKDACLAAARPNVDPKYHNYCVQCLPSYMDEGLSVIYLIPAEPKVLEKVESVKPRSGVGVAFNGVKIDAPAPIGAILDAHTLAVFDDCGGHVNTHVGYHYHAITDCTEKASTDGKEDHAIAIGYALDGYKLYSHKNLDGSVPEDLDRCGGHISAGIGYHYHVNDAGENQVLSCFVAESGCVLEGDNSSTDCSAHDYGRPPVLNESMSNKE